MRVVGLDIGRGGAVACVLNSFPPNIQKHYKHLVNCKGFVKLPTSRSGVETLLNLSPDAIVLEPTGHWYSHFWARVAQNHQIKTYWVGHSDLDKQRGCYGFVNKRDTEDALCLAALYFDDRFVDSVGNKRFLTHYYYFDEAIERARETFLAKEQLQKLRGNLISQLRQRLSYEFPEIAQKTFNIGVRGYTPAIGWLANLGNYPQYDKLYKLSIAPALGINISKYTRAHAKTLTQIEQRIVIHKNELEGIINQDGFAPYQRVFDRFGFGIDNRALLLYHIYPLEKFLVNGKPWVEKETTPSGKVQKRHRSLRKFQAYLGLSYSIAQSGNAYSRSFHGSTLVRSHLYVWAVCMIAPNKGGYRVRGEVGRVLCDRYQELKNITKGKDALIRILFKATRMLFYELLKEIS